MTSAKWDRKTNAPPSCFHVHCKSPVQWYACFIGILALTCVGKRMQNINFPKIKLTQLLKSGGFNTVKTAYVCHVPNLVDVIYHIVLYCYFISLNSNMSCHGIWYGMIWYDSISYHITSRRVMSRHVTSHHNTSYHIFDYIMPCYIGSYITLGYIVWYYIMYIMYDENTWHPIYVYKHNFHLYHSRWA